MIYCSLVPETADLIVSIECGDPIDSELTLRDTLAGQLGVTEGRTRALRSRGCAPTTTSRESLDAGTRIAVEPPVQRLHLCAGHDQIGFQMLYVVVVDFDEVEEIAESLQGVFGLLH